VIEGVRGAMVGVYRHGLPPPLVADLKHLAAVNNPKFFQLQQQRKSTWEVPRLIRCYEEDLEHLWLPRGLEEHVGRAVAEAGSKLQLRDVLEDPEPLDLRFEGSLSATRQAAVEALAPHALGVLVAPTGGGKTVMGSHSLRGTGPPLWSSSIGRSPPTSGALS
jgi:hypothetical protein